MISTRSSMLPRPVPGRPPRPRAPEAHRWKLANGLRVVAVPRRELPQVAMRLILPAGSAADPEGLAGLAALTGSLLTEGAGALSGEELNRRLDRIGASMSVQVGHDFAEIDLLLLSETLREGIGLLATVLTAPSFPAEELERVRAETAEGLDARLDEPGNVADDALASALFGPDHPYGRLPLGTVESVEALERPHVADFHERHYRPDGAVLVVAGDVVPGTLEGLLPDHLAAWSGAAAKPAYPRRSEGRMVPRTDERRISIAWDDASQSEIRVGGIGMTRDSGDWIVASLANYLLGGSTITGRLGSNLREEKGWTYGVRSGFSATVEPGAWGIETAVDGAVTEAAIAEIRKELERFTGEPVPEEELQRGKDALILSLPRAFETPGRIVARLATVEAFGLPHDYWSTFPDRVEAATRDEVRRVAETYFDPARLVAVSVGT